MKARARHSLPSLTLLLALAALAMASCASTPKAPERSPYDLVLKTVGGERFDLTELQGKVVIVTFFATWCLPCMVEVPTYVDLQSQHAAQGFTVVGIGMDLEGAKSLAPFVDTFHVQYPVLIADDEVRDGRSPYGAIASLPTTYILDRRGRVAAAYEGPANPAGLRAMVDKLLAR